MEKKYYDLILSIIKNNKRYPGLEPILEDIANRVFEQAKSIFDSIDDINVIEAYLEKAVKTAIVTVPRKLGYKTAREERKNIIQVQEIIAKEEDNTLITDVEAIESPTDENIVIEEPEYIETIGEEIISEEVIEEEEEEEEDSSEGSVHVDIELVDKMINGVNKTDDTENSLNIDEDTLEIYDSLENFQELDNSTELEEINIEQSVEELEIEEVQHEETENIEITESLENIDFDTNLEDLEVEELEYNLEEDEEKEDDDVVVSETYISTNLNIEEFEIDDSQESIDNVENQEYSEEKEEKREEEFTNFYNLFNFEPSVSEDFSEELINIINVLNNKFPEKRILEICQLKYNKKLSIKEISEQTGLDISSIIEALNEVIDAIKD